MYVLYEFEQDYDGGQCSILATSKDKSKLEERKLELENKAKEFAEANRKHNELLRDFRNKKANLLADWFEENIEAILEYSSEDKYDKYKSCGWGQNPILRTYSDWHTGSFGPYHPDIILKKRKEFIQKIRNGQDPSYPYKKETFIDHSKVKTPYPKDIENMKIELEPPNREGVYGHLYIDEVEEV